MKRIDKYTYKNIKIQPFTTPMFDALVSIPYNLGKERMEDSREYPMAKG